MISFSSKKIGRMVRPTYSSLNKLPHLSSSDEKISSLLFWFCCFWGLPYTCHTLAMLLLFSQMPVHLMLYVVHLLLSQPFSAQAEMDQRHVFTLKGGFFMRDPYSSYLANLRRRQQQPERRGCRVVLVGVLLVIAIVLLVVKLRINSNTSGFRDLSLYISISPASNSDSASYVVGKIIVINRQERTIDALNDDPRLSDLRAQSPREVGTIIWIDCSEAVVGTYMSGSHGYQWNCNVTVIDKAKNVIITTQSFSGPLPPEVKECCSDWHGDRPDTEMVNFIESLPRRSR
jgi:hypothetical protein